MSSISIPKDLSKGHDAQQDDGAAQLGRKWAETFSEVGGLTGESAVLDIGCGPGRMAIAVGDRFGWTNDYLGFEIKKKDVLWCQENITSQHPNFVFAHLDVRNDQYNPKGRIEPDVARFPSDDTSRDFCFATSVFTHMFAREVEHYIHEAARSLKPGGTFLSTWFALDDLAYRGIESGGARFRFEHEHHGVRVQIAESPEEAVAYTRPQIESMLTGAGFEDICFSQGGWMGSKVERSAPARHAQDVFVARKIA